MPKCWTCGGTVSKYSYNCNSCRSLTELISLYSQVEGRGEALEDKIGNLIEAQTVTLDNLAEQISSEIENIACLIQWGFNHISWILEEQTEVLKKIDTALKTPSQTQANEYRIIAGELVNRGVLDESLEFFEKSLGLNPLDFRSYIGNAQCLIKKGEFERAIVILEKSLPHAPRDNIDYQSYSYRLIGHIFDCGENYFDAEIVLRKAVSLSPNYADALYDHAKYSALIYNEDAAIVSLKKAIIDKPLYWDVAKNEKAFSGLENLQRMLNSLQANVKDIFNQVRREGMMKLDVSSETIRVQLERAEPLIRKAKNSTPSKYNYGQGNPKTGQTSIDMFEAAQMKFSRIRNELVAELSKSEEFIESPNFSRLIDAMSSLRTSVSEFLVKTQIIEDQISNAGTQVERDINLWDIYISEKVSDAGPAAPFCGMVGAVAGGYWLGVAGFLFLGIIGFAFPCLAVYLYLKFKEG